MVWLIEVFFFFGWYIFVSVMCLGVVICFGFCVFGFFLVFILLVW